MLDFASMAHMDPQVLDLGRLAVHHPIGFVAKVAAAFSIVLVAVGAAGVFSVWRLVDASEKNEQAISKFVDEVVHAERLRASDDGQAATGRGYLITRDPEFLTRLDEEEVGFERTLRHLRSHLSSESGSKVLNDVFVAEANYKDVQHRVLVEEADNVDPGTIRRSFEREIMPRRRALSRAIDALVNLSDTRLREAYADSRTTISRAVATSTIGISIAVLASAAFAWATGRHLAGAYRNEALASRSAARALSARDELLGVVAHDLRNPLGAIVLKAAILERSQRESERKQAQAIVTVAKRMDHLITCLLDAASMEAGRFTVIREPCNAAEALQEAIEAVSDSADAKSIRVELRIEERSLPMSADRERFIQVVTNLLANAIKFTFDGGAVTLLARLVGDELAFSIVDTGPGIAPEHLPHVFERFWSSTPRKNGTGLGLYIAKGIIDAHGGRIRVESQLGHGATFHFSMPVASPPPSQASAPKV